MTKLGLGKKFRLLVLCGAALWMLAACGNTSGDVDSGVQAGNEMGVVIGQIQNVGSVTRTAMPTIPTITGYDVSAINTADGNTETGTVSNSGSGYTFSMALKFGTWDITVSAKSGNKIILTQTRTVTLNAANPTITASYDFSYTKAGSKGNIDLQIQCPAEIDSVKYTLGTLADNVAATLTGSNPKTLEIKYNDVPIGSYNLSVFFYGAGGNLLYRIDQTVNVFGGLTTDTFTKDSNYVDTNGAIKINEDNLKEFMLTTIYVGGTGLTGKAANDSNMGSQFDPLGTLSKAITIVNNSLLTPSTGFKIIVQGNNTQRSNMISLGNGKKVAILGDASTRYTMSETYLFKVAGELEIKNLTFNHINFEVGNATQAGLLDMENCAITGSVIPSTGKAGCEDVTSTKGGAINIVKGTVSLKDCSLSGNSATGGGNAIYNNGTLKLSGAMQFAANQDIYLAQDSVDATKVKPITIDGDLTSAAVGSIKVVPQVYTAGAPILEDGGTFVATNYAKFAVADQNTGGTVKKWEIDNTGKLAASTSAKLETVYLNSSATTSGNGTEDSPVKTLTEAFVKLDTDQTNPTIVIMATYSVPRGEEGLLNRAGASGNKVTLQRYYKDSSTYCKYSLLYFGNNDAVTIANITIDGNWKAGGGTGEVRIANSNGTLIEIYGINSPKVTLGNGAVLKNNSFSLDSGSSGCAVAAAHFADFCMEEGSQITGNKSSNLGCIYINSNSKVVINNGSISSNDTTSVINNSGGTLIVNGGWISGNTVRNAINNCGGGTLTVNDGRISNNSGATGIYNWGSAKTTITNCFISSNSIGINISGGSVTISGGTIMSNDNYGVYASSGGSLILSGSAQIYSGNIVYLNNTSGNCPITVGALSGSGTVAKIRMGNYNNSYNQILQADGTNVTEITPAICSRFWLENSEYIIKPDPSDTTKAIFAKPSSDGTVALPGTYTFTLKQDSSSIANNSTVYAGKPLTFSVKNAAGEDVSGTYRMELRQNGKAFLSADANTLTIPDSLAGLAGTYDIYMKVQTPEGYTNDTVSGIKIIEPIP